MLFLLDTASKYRLKRDMQVIDEQAIEINGVTIQHIVARYKGDLLYITMKNHNIVHVEELS